MPAFRSTVFLNSIAANQSRQTTSSVNLDRQIGSIMRNLEKVVGDFSKKDRQRITRKAAQPIAREAKKTTAFDDSKRPHRRKRGTKVITYNSGNLRRSLRVISLRRTADAYVGPQFARASASSYGGVGQPVDGYYAAARFGSGLRFRRQVLEPALQRGSANAIRILRKESDLAITNRGRRAGFKVTR